GWVILARIILSWALVPPLFAASTLIPKQTDAESANAVFAIAVVIATVTFATVTEMGSAANVVEAVIADESKRSYPFRVNLGKPSLSRATRNGDAAMAGKFG
ncbi:MAG: hypothetical protein AAF614_14860, partial [Chloroflexota bacterium]